MHLSLQPDQMVFPAYAGVSLVDEISGAVRQGLPRLRGGEPSHSSTSPAPNSSSPPTRG